MILVRDCGMTNGVFAGMITIGDHDASLPARDDATRSGLKIIVRITRGRPPASANPWLWRHNAIGVRE